MDAGEVLLLQLLEASSKFSGSALRCRVLGQSRAGNRPAGCGPGSGTEVAHFLIGPAGVRTGRGRLARPASPFFFFFLDERGSIVHEDYWTVIYY